MIRISKLQKKYNDNYIIKDFNYLFEDKSLNIITGKSGSGKTTLLNIIGMLDKNYEGELTIDKQVYRHINRRMYYKNFFGFVFQNYALLDNSTVFDNLSIPLNIKNLDKFKKKYKINEALDKVNLNGFENRKVYELSGGEKQRVALARLILKNPKYIFADEPTGNLDETNTQIVKDILLDLNNDGKTVFIATHDKIFIKKYDNLIYMDTIND